MTSVAALLSQVDSDIQLRPVSGSHAEVLGPRIMIAILLIWAAGFAIGFQAALALLTIVGFLLAAIYVARPSVGLLGVGMLCALDPISRHFLATGGLFRWNSFNYFLLIIILLYSPRILRLRGLQIRILQLFMAVMAGGLVFSPSRMSGTHDLLNVVAPLGLVVYFICANHDYQTWNWLGMINGTLGAAGGLVYYIQQDQLPAINQNAFSYFPLTAIFSICLASVSAKRHFQGALFLLVAINLCWVLLSGSRGGLFVGALCVIYLTIQTSGVGRRLALLGTAVLIGLFILARFPELLERTEQRVTKLADGSRSHEDRTSGRSNLVIGGQRIFLNHPLGVGTGGYASAWANLENREGLGGWKEGRAMAAHSGWLKTTVENGLPGILLHVIYVLSFALVAWHKRTEGVLAFGLMVTLTLSVAFLSAEFQSKGLWLLAAGAMAILGRENPVMNRDIHTPHAPFQRSLV